MARADDRKRSMVSRLLRRAMCSRALGVAWSEVKIDKTKGRKPFAVAPGGRNPPWAPNFNFNISHEGDWVVGVAEGFCLCGVDVAAPPEMRPKAVRVFTATTATYVLMAGGGSPLLAWVHT